MLDLNFGLHSVFELDSLQFQGSRVRFRCRENCVCGLTAGACTHFLEMPCKEMGQIQMPMEGSSCKHDLPQ